MSEEIERRRSGQFAAGQSGNPAGARTRKRTQLITPEDFHRTVLKVAASATQIAINGKSQPVTLLESNVWGLASGKAANRLASKDFLDLARSAAYAMERQEHREAEAAKRRLRNS